MPALFAVVKVCTHDDARIAERENRQNYKSDWFVLKMFEPVQKRMHVVFFSGKRNRKCQQNLKLFEGF